MSTGVLVAAASLCMVVSDILATVMVQAEADNRKHVAALMDTIGWFVSITTTSISINAINSNDVMRQVLVLVFVGASNYVGTYLGVGIGAKLLKRKPQAGPLTEAALRAVSRDSGLKP
jgi:hypothetical protein